MTLSLSFEMWKFFKCLVCISLLKFYHGQIARYDQIQISCTIIDSTWSPTSRVCKWMLNGSDLKRNYFDAKNDCPANHSLGKLVTPVCFNFTAWFYSADTNRNVITYSTLNLVKFDINDPLSANYSHFICQDSKLLILS